MKHQGSGGGDGTRPEDFTTEEVRRALEEVTRPKEPQAQLAVVPPVFDEPEPEPVRHPLRADILPGPARAWAEACARMYAMPETMPTIAAICAAASVLQGRVRVKWKEGVEEPVCLYWLVFSPTGTQKSGVLSRATAAIRRLEAAKREDVETEERRRHGERKWRESQLSRLRRQKMPPERLAREAWRQEMAELEAELEALEVPKAPQWLHGDVNPSLLPKILRHNYEAEGIARCSILVDEGTFLSNITGRHQGGTQVETLLSAINGAPLDFVRASQTSDDMVSIRLDRTYMTICALVQPDYYDRITSDQKLADCGFLGRTIRTVLDDPPVKIPWDAPPIPDHVQAAYDAWLTGLATQEVPEVVDLLADAATGRAVASLYERAEVDGTGFSRRVVGLVARIAAIIAVGSSPVSESGSGSVGGYHCSQEYDYVDELYEREERLAIGGIGEPSGGGRDGTEGAPPLTRVINDLFLFIYIYTLREVRATELPADPLRALVRGVWGALGRLSPIEKLPDRRRRRVRDLAKRWDGRARPSMDRIYRALEELEQRGLIEWVPESARRYKGEMRYRELILIGEPPRHLRAVEGDGNT